MSNNDNTEDREPLNTLNMIEEAFFSKLNATTKDKISKAERNDPVEKISVPKSNINTEKLLIELYDMRDEMIDSFKDVDISSRVASTLTKNINKIGSFIKSYGGKVDTFNPLDMASGLELPDLTLNAERVIDNTRRAYRLGQIKDANISKNGKEILIEFAGVKDDMDYMAKGTICAKGSWTGSEAIDYIYTPGEGKMSVKALNNEGRWADRSADFEISWELWEDKKDSQEQAEKDEEVKTAGKEEKKAEIKEEVKNDSQNNLDEDIGDFPIEDKNEHL